MYFNWVPGVLNPPSRELSSHLCAYWIMNGKNSYLFRLVRYEEKEGHYDRKKTCRLALKDLRELTALPVEGMLGKLRDPTKACLPEIFYQQLLSPLCKMVFSGYDLLGRPIQEQFSRIVSTLRSQKTGDLAVVVYQNLAQFADYDVGSFCFDTAFFGSGLLARL